VYQLAPFVFACTTGRNCMFLDLRQDRYLSVPQALMDALAPQIHGWPHPIHAHEAHAIALTDGARLAEDLLAAGILRPYQRGTDVPHPQPPPATGDLGSPDHRCHEAISHRYSMRALSALAAADCALRLLPLWRIAARIAVPSQSTGLTLASDRLGRARTLTRCFQLTRPWYPRDYLCLFDSLALTLFLRRYNIRTHWIFGVREDPFAAHCWVQFAGVVLNEHLDRAHLYTPIMAV
jgi:hypothetical protein